MIRKNTSILLLALLFSLSTSIVGQHVCGFDDLMHSNPEYLEAVKKQTQNFKNFQKQNALRRSYTYQYDTIYEIPVVFHILYNNAAENIPDSCVLSQIEVLNEDFNRTNPDTGTTRSEFLGVAGSMRMKFVLADKDPSGNAHSGIIRKTTSITSFSETSGGQYDSRMKFNSQGGSDAWDTDKYLNVWVCDMFPTSGGSFVAGYATPPTGAENWPSNVQFPSSQQGAVVHYYTVGRYNPRATANGANALGRTTTHELGHYFGLFHTWGLRSGTCSVDEDDFLDDTPNSASANYGCNLNRNSCQLAEPGDLPDMVENYMDYSFGSCQNMFSKEQVDLMKYNMISLRPEIYTPIVLVDSIPGCDDNVRPMLFANPGTKLIIGANNYSTTSFSINVYDNLGKHILKDVNIILNNSIELTEGSALALGHYTVRIKNNSSGEVLIYKWQKIPAN